MCSGNKQQFEVTCLKDLRLNKCIFLDYVGRGRVCLLVLATAVWLVLFRCFEHTLVLMKVVCIVLEMDIDFAACYCFYVTLKMN